MEKPFHVMRFIFQGNHVEKVSFHVCCIYLFIFYSFISYLTLNFSLSHERITYRKEYGGFQCDAICEDGCTFTFYFINKQAPNNYTYQGIIPLYSRVIFMFDKLKCKYHNCRLEKLYISSKFCEYS